MEEIAPGIWHWTARHPRIGIEVSSYLLAEEQVVLDPIAPPLGRLEELGPPELVLLTNRHHYRDSAALVERFGCAVKAPRPGMHEFTSGEPVEPYDFGESLAGEAIVAHEVGAICPDDAALHVPGRRALAVADGVINEDGLSFVPDRLMDDPDRTKAGLRESYRRLCDELDFDVLLTAHGDPVVGDAREALRGFLEAS